MISLPSIETISKVFCDSGVKAQFSEDNGLTIQSGANGDYSTPISEGGKYVSRAVMNAIGNLCLQGLAFHSFGGHETFRSGISYPLGALLSWEVGNSVYLVRSTKVNNTDNFLTNTSYIGTSWQIVSAIGNVLVYPRMNIESNATRETTVRTTGYTRTQSTAILFSQKDSADYIEFKSAGANDWLRIPLTKTVQVGTGTSTRRIHASFFLNTGDSVRFNKDVKVSYWSVKER